MAIRETKTYVSIYDNNIRVNNEDRSIRPNSPCTILLLILNDCAEGHSGTYCKTA